MSIEFNKRELEALKEVAVTVEEFHYEMRKGVSQSKYVFVVEHDATWSDWDKVDGSKNDDDFIDMPVPQNLVGYWVMDYAANLQYENLQECIKRYSWVKCHKVETVSYEWETL